MKENKTAERGHEYYMKSAIDLALIAKARDDSPVGSVVVQDGVIIGEGIEGGKTKKGYYFSCRNSGYSRGEYYHRQF